MDHYAATAQSRGGATTATLRRQGSNSFYDERQNNPHAAASAVGYYGGDRVTAPPQYHPQQQQYQQQRYGQQFQHQQEPSDGGSPSKKFNANKKSYAKQKRHAPSSSSSSATSNKIAITLDKFADNLIEIITTSKIYNIIGLLFLFMTFITIISRYRLSSDPDIADVYTSLRRYRLGGNHAMELPNDWNNWSLSDFKHEFMCRHHFNRESFSLYTWDQWEILRTTFNKVVAEEQGGDNNTVDFNKDTVPPTKGYSFGGIAGNTPPFYADQTERGTRGLFASRNIKKGELVHDGTETDITFPSVQSFRKFMFALPKKNMACDFTEWVWTQKKEAEGGKMYIMSVFNIAIYMNDAVEAGKEVNALPKKVDKGENKKELDHWWHKVYATKDIEKGEEILTHYAHYDDDWDKVGLGH